jgi:hypothetical protein
MSRKEELLKMAHLLRAQADAMNSRDAKQAFRKMADYYQREAEQLQGRPVPEIMPTNRRINRLRNLSQRQIANQLSTRA